MMSKITLFVLPLIAAVGMYFLIGMLLPDLSQTLALIAAVIIGWVIRIALEILQKQTARNSS
jgi:hypothetical protein